MKNNSDIPDGWAMLNDLTKKRSDVLNNEPITPEDELSKALEEMVRDIALSEIDPQDWAGWFTCWYN